MRAVGVDSPWWHEAEMGRIVVPHEDRSDRAANAGFELQPGAVPRSMKTERIILIPGLGIAGLDLLPLAFRLRGKGYRVSVFWHFIGRPTLEESARRLFEMAGRQEEEVVHFVGHSLGGIVVLRMPADHPWDRPGRTQIRSPFPKAASSVSSQEAGPVFTEGGSSRGSRTTRSSGSTRRNIRGVERV